MNKPFAIVGVIALALQGSAAIAHHSPNMFDPKKAVTLTGTVREFQWTNPHCYIQLVVGSGARQVEWNLEMGAPMYLYNRGWRPSILKAGDRITVTIAPLRSGARGGLVETAARADGTPLGSRPLEKLQ
jgi:hypothetical protein